LGQLTSSQLSEWEAYDRLDPIGSWREDYRLAYITSVITNIATSVHGEKNAKYSNPMDFMLNWDMEDNKEVEPEKQSTEQQKEWLLNFATRQNKKHNRAANKKPPKVIPKKRKV
jgi:hypothetical protein